MTGLIKSLLQPFFSGSHNSKLVSWAPFSASLLVYSLGDTRPHPPDQSHLSRLPESHHPSTRNISPALVLSLSPQRASPGFGGVHVAGEVAEGWRPVTFHCDGVDRDDSLPLRETPRPYA